MIKSRFTIRLMMKYDSQYYTDDDKNIDNNYIGDEKYT